MDIETAFSAAIAAQEQLAAANAEAASLCAGYLLDLFTAVGIAPHDEPARTIAALGITPGRYEHVVDGHTVRMAVVHFDAERPKYTFGQETLARMTAIGSLMLESLKLALSLIARRCPYLGALRLLIVKNTGDVYLEQYPTHCVTMR